MIDDFKKKTTITCFIECLVFAHVFFLSLVLSFISNCTGVSNFTIELILKLFYLIMYIVSPI